MRALGAREVADRVLALLPSDGSPILNRVMRVMLSQHFERSISEDLYAEARDLLESEKKIARQRGQGGQICLIAPAANNGVKAKSRKPAAQPETLYEADLMASVEQYLGTTFRKGLDLPEGCFSAVRDTSKMGPPLGKWARPDFILVTAMRFDLMPVAQVDVHSFELKTEYGATDLAVYEALAHTRFTHFGHLIWHLPAKSSAENRLADIAEQCTTHGIGLIRALDVKDFENYQIILDPVRKPTLPTEVELFLRIRLEDHHKNALREVTRGNRT
ncbi:MAG: hypothetical protein EKK40_18115 [Bradyrhizobiaceae bacterium]|nr:MAG: hypothetical protein EKK40_18115 [Bradyrhizobiaceae bacterium]